MTFDEVCIEVDEAKLKLEGERVMLLKFDPQDKHGLIHIPDEAKQTPICGKVILHSTDMTNICRGTVAYFRPHSDLTMPLGIYGEEPLLSIVHAKDIIFVRK
jgi:hypothetical protein